MEGPSRHQLPWEEVCPGVGLGQLIDDAPDGCHGECRAMADAVRVQSLGTKRRLQTRMLWLLRHVREGGEARSSLPHDEGKYEKLVSETYRLSWL